MPPISPVVIITGEGEQGQNIVAMSYVEMAVQEDRQVFHNGCSNRGSRITAEALSSDQQLETLMGLAPEESVFVLADADCVPALAPKSAGTNPEWMTICKAKRHLVVLTTVRGLEFRLRGPISDQETSHLLVEAIHDMPGLFVTGYWGALRERMPVASALIKHDDVMDWIRSSDGSYLASRDSQAELIDVPPKTIVVPANCVDAVRSTETPLPMHPANPFLLTTTTRINPHFSIKTTEIIGLIWLESVNKRRDEEMAIQTIEWACERWGIELTDVRCNKAPTYPDGWAETTDGTINIEVTKVQPRWPSSATLAQLTAGTRAGKAPNPKQAPVIQCRQCGAQEVPAITNIHILPDHDDSHVWTCIYPKNMIGPDWPGNLTAFPELKISRGQIGAAVTRAVTEKNNRAIRFGRGKQNWLVLIIEGFPPLQGFDALLRDFDWRDFDGVFAIISEEFGSAIHGYYPDDDRMVVNLKCPQEGCHFCYHPGFVVVVRKADDHMDELREMGREKGVTFQTTDRNGNVLAEAEKSPPQPVSEQDLLRGIRSATKRLPYQPLVSWDGPSEGFGPMDPQAIIWK